MKKIEALEIWRSHNLIIPTDSFSVVLQVDLARKLARALQQTPGQLKGSEEETPWHSLLDELQSPSGYTEHTHCSPTYRRFRANQGQANENQLGLNLTRWRSTGLWPRQPCETIQAFVWSVPLERHFRGIRQKGGAGQNTTAERNTGRYSWSSY